MDEDDRRNARVGGSQKFVAIGRLPRIVGRQAVVGDSFFFLGAVDLASRRRTASADEPNRIGRILRRRHGL